MDTGTIMFNTAFKYMGGPKFGTGPGRGEERCLWPIAMHTCPPCGVDFPAGLRMCHSCAKPIHYPDGMFYADTKDRFGVEYYGVHAEWLCDVITSGDFSQYRLHTYDDVKFLRNFPVSRSLAEDHRRTAFFGVSAIQCASVDLSTHEIELFKKSVRGTLQGAIRFDVSIERLVSGLTGKDSTMSIEEFFKSGTSAADTLTKHYGSLFINCREKTVCFYDRWSIHCRMAYRLCLQKAPYYTGGEIGGPPDQETMEALQAVHDTMDATISRMRSQMTLRAEEDAMANFRATMKNPEKFKRYLRVDSESLSMLLAKMTLTTCYGIPRKGEPGYISERENEDSPEMSTKSKVEKWKVVDPIGSVVPVHHTDPGYQVLGEGKCLPLGDESTPTMIGMEFSKAVEEMGQKTKASIDKDVDVENEFFRQAEGKIPRRAGNDPAFMKTPNVSS
eukprot:s3868_g2.t1